MILTRHSAEKRTMKARLTLFRIASMCGACSSVSTIMVIMLSRISTMIRMSNACFPARSKKKPCTGFWRRGRKGWSDGRKERRGNGWRDSRGREGGRERQRIGGRERKEGIVLSKLNYIVIYFSKTMFVK